MTAEFGEIICFRLVTDKAWDGTQERGALGSFGTSECGTKIP